MTLAYVDSSAFLTLVLPEPESGAVETELRRHSLVSSRLLVAESRRAVLRSGDSDAGRRLDIRLASVRLRDLTSAVITAAGSLAPWSLRTLDALHLASAVALPRLDVFVSHDGRLLEAAAAAGLTVVDPR